MGRAVPALGMLGELAGPVEERLADLDRRDIPRRIWDRDHTVWREDPTEIEDRLGWLDLPSSMAARLDEVRTFAAGCLQDGLTGVLLCGMGGSSLAPEVLATMFPTTGMELLALDSTHPDQILAAERDLGLDRTLILVSSKSGTTIETTSHLEYFWGRIGDGSRFAAITDPGTPMDELALRRGFRAVFRNDPDVGGRYSALSLVGLVPAALIGTDPGALLGHARRMAARCGPEVPAAGNPGVWLGAVMAEAARAGHDKLTLVLDAAVASFGTWIEQLVAESTGKDGLGILPVEGEDLGPPAVYGPDRLFVGIGGDRVAVELEPLALAGHPLVHLPLEDPAELGGEMFRWELATAVAGAILGINPFDQPNVQEAKDATAQRLSNAGPNTEPDPADDDLGSLSDLLGSLRRGDYLAIQAYAPRDPSTEAPLQAARLRLRDRLRVATTLGFGPRYLHSTGQFHKGGPDTGLFVQVIDPPSTDLPVPGRPYSFATLMSAQAAGDLAALRRRGRRVARVPMTTLLDAAAG